MAAQKASIRDANGAGDRQHARPRRIHPATDAGAGDGVWASSTYHGGTSNHSTSEVTIGQVNVDTKAPDAKGIADAIAPKASACGTGSANAERSILRVLRHFRSD